MKITLLIGVSLISWAVAAPIDGVKNDKVAGYEETLRPGETESAAGALPSATVFFNDGSIRITPAAGASVTRQVKRGDVIYREPRDGTLSATGRTEMHFMRIEFPGSESDIAWGTSGFAPDYKMLVENRHARVYDIHIPAGGGEPQHSHHDRVVVCLSGADLRHILPDGHQEDSSIKTGACLWRKGQTHIGRNIGKTDLWVIAIEPK